MRSEDRRGGRREEEPLCDPLREYDEDILRLDEDDSHQRREEYPMSRQEAYPMNATVEKGTNTERTLATMGKDDYYDGEDESQWDLDTYRSKFKCIVGRLNERYNWSRIMRKQYAAVNTRNDEVSAKYYKQTSTVRSLERRERKAYEETHDWRLKFDLREIDYDVAKQKIDEMRVVHKYMLEELHLNSREISSLQKQLERAKIRERDNNMTRNITPEPEIKGDSKTWTAFDIPIRSRRSKKQNDDTYEIETEQAVTSRGSWNAEGRDTPMPSSAITQGQDIVGRVNTMPSRAIYKGQNTVEKTTPTPEHALYHDQDAVGRTTPTLDPAIYQGQDTDEQPEPSSRSNSRSDEQPAPSSSHDRSNEQPAPSSSHNRSDEQPAPSSSHNRSNEQPAPSSSHNRSNEQPGPSSSHSRNDEQPAPSNRSHSRGASSTSPTEGAITEKDISHQRVASEGMSQGATLQEQTNVCTEEKDSSLRSASSSRSSSRRATSTSPTARVTSPKAISDQHVASKGMSRGAKLQEQNVGTGEKDEQPAASTRTSVRRATSTYPTEGVASPKAISDQHVASKGMSRGAKLQEQNVGTGEKDEQPAASTRTSVRRATSTYPTEGVASPKSISDQQVSSKGMSRGAKLQEQNAGGGEKDEQPAAPTRTSSRRATSTPPAEHATSPKDIYHQYVTSKDTSRGDKLQEQNVHTGEKGDQSVASTRTSSRRDTITFPIERANNDSIGENDVRSSPPTRNSSRRATSISPTERVTSSKDIIDKPVASKDIIRGEISIEGDGKLTVENVTRRKNDDIGEKDVRPSAPTRRAASTSPIERAATHKQSSDQRVASTLSRSSKLKKQNDVMRLQTEVQSDEPPETASGKPIGRAGNIAPPEAITDKRTTLDILSEHLKIEERVVALAKKMQGVDKQIKVSPANKKGKQKSLSKQCKSDSAPKIPFPPKVPFPPTASRISRTITMPERPTSRTKLNSDTSSSTNESFNDLIIGSAMKTSTAGDKKKDNGVAWYRKMGKSIRSLATAGSSSTSKLPKIDEPSSLVLGKSRSSGSFSRGKISVPKLFRSRPNKVTPLNNVEATNARILNDEQTCARNN